MKKMIYLDDVRTPTSPDWVVVRDYDEFVNKVMEIGLGNIDTISLDHDLGESAMSEYFNNVSPNYQLDYSKIYEKTGYDCAKWLVNYWYEVNHPDEEALTPVRERGLTSFPIVYTHSANPIGSANIMGYINNFLMNHHVPQTCTRVRIEHTV